MNPIFRTGSDSLEPLLAEGATQCSGPMQGLHSADKSWAIIGNVIYLRPCDAFRFTESHCNLGLTIATFCR